MSRLSPPDPARLTPDQREIYTAICNGPRKSVPAPLGVWLRRPELARHAQALGRYCRYGSSLSPRLSELAIMLMGKFWRAELEWRIHKAPALEAGLGEDILDAIRDGEEPPFANRDEKAVYAFITQLQANRSVDDAAYAEAVAVLGEDGVVDLVGIFGYYSLISATILAFDLSSGHCEGPWELGNGPKSKPPA